MRRRALQAQSLETSEANHSGLETERFEEQAARRREQSRGKRTLPPRSLRGCQSRDKTLETTAPAIISHTLSLL